MRVGFGAMREPSEENLRFARQLGVDAIILHTPDVAGDGYWEFLPLLRLRRRIEAAGLEFYAIENLPHSHYDRILLGAPGRDEQIAKVCTTIRNLGRAGIPVLGYHFMLNSVWRTEYTPTGRGGAYVTKYDHRLAQRAPLYAEGEFDEEAVWANLTYFLQAVVPVAEEAGVMLALHPDDPPVPEIAGVARVIRSIEAYRRVLSIVDSPANGIEWCQGTMAEGLPPEDVYAGIREFASQGKIAYVHFRNVRGQAECFEETFIDEGQVDMLEAMRAYHESGFRGVFIVDHTPGVVNDTDWGHRGRAYAMGYIQALRHCVMSGSGDPSRRRPRGGTA